MVSAIRERVTVQAGGRIEIRSSDLPVGAQADVIVVLDRQEQYAELVISVARGEVGKDAVTQLIRGYAG